MRPTAMRHVVANWLLHYFVKNHQSAGDVHEFGGEGYPVSAEGKKTGGDEHG